MADPHAHSPVQRAGLGKTHILVGEVYRVFPDLFCVSVQSSYDRMFFEQIMVASSFLHPEGGAGYTWMPKVGTKVVVVVPGDTSPPFVIGSLPMMRSPEGMPEGTEVEDEELSKRARRPEPSFDTNRPPYMPGDQALVGPVNNGMVAYEMGVAEFRSGPINKTLLHPDGKHQQLYRTHEATWPGGFVSHKSLLKGEGRAYRTVDVFRHKQEDRYGTLRVQKGGYGTGEPDSLEKSWTGQLGEAGATEDEMVMEVAAIPDGFSTSDGGLAKDTDRNRSVFRLLLTKAGDLLVRVGRSLVLKILKNLNITVDDTVVLRGKKIVIQASEELVIGSPSGTTTIQGGTINAGGGARGVFGQGDIAQVNIPPGTGIVGLLSGQPFKGQFEIPSPSFPVIMVGSGSPKVKIPLCPRR